MSPTKGLLKNTDNLTVGGIFMNHYKFSIVCLLFGTVMAFQNCGTNNKNSFSPESYKTTSSSSGVKGSSSLSPEQLQNMDLIPLDNKEPSSPSATIGAVQATTSESEVSDGDNVITEGPKDFICVLAGKGKSTRLGIEARDLQSVNNTTQTVCMSEVACLDVVAKKLQVQSAEKRGYCKGNSPHVVILDIQQIIGLIEKL